ncbi:hypothetical protein [Dactylococcopsis salina]|uniref:hypothetical protein n=1 Tax=Dactylococcopsis salina TaxID=292566 RepID=UPI0012EA3B59|nr:hypothetical protein [Dactylococcopsis salina]
MRRSTIYPISAGDTLTLEIIVENPTSQPKTLLQVIDHLPDGFGKPAKRSIELIPPQDSYSWIYSTDSTQRGIYHWSKVDLRTATPLGLFWSSRHRVAKAKAIDSLAE